MWMIRISCMGRTGRKVWMDFFKNTPVVSLEEFRFAFRLAISAASLDTPVENPETFGVDLLTDDGGITRVRFKDRPMNRAMLAIGKHLWRGQGESPCHYDPIHGLARTTLPRTLVRKR